MTTYQQGDVDNNKIPKGWNRKLRSYFTALWTDILQLKRILIWATLFSMSLSAYFVFLTVTAFMAGEDLQGLFHAALAAFIILAPPSAILFTERTS